MVVSSPAHGRVRAAIACALGSLLVTLVPAVPAHAAEPCPDPYPLSEVTAGLPGEGLTVDEGTTPEPFTVTVKGVITDGIAPGKDLIIADTDSEAIRRVGGIWYGMSGSPVYTADGRLLGAVAYGGSAGPSPLAGITPAQYMYDLRSAPASAASAQSAEQVDIPAGMQARMVANGDMTAAQAEAGFSRLRVPLGVSGLSAQRMDQAEKWLGREGVMLHSAGAVSTSAAGAPTDIVAGGNFAAGLSYGDFSAIGVGTTTAVCGTEALAFGHPFTFAGATTNTAHGADAITIQDDSTFGPYKIANPTGPVGTVDQDRLAAIRGQIGPVPQTVPVTSHVARSDGPSRDGETQVAARNELSYLAALHTLVNVDSVFDQYGPGTSTVQWTIRGTRADGTPWTLERTNRYGSRWDIGFESIWELYEQLDRLGTNRFADPRIESVDVDAGLDPQYADYTIAGVSALVAGEWRPVTQNNTVRLVAGTRQRFRITLQPYRGTEQRNVEVAVVVPAGTAGSFAELEVGGGGYVSRRSGAKSFDGLLEVLASAPRNDDLVARLHLYDFKTDRQRTSTGMTRVDQVVNDSSWFTARVVKAAKARPAAVRSSEWTVADGVRARPAVERRFTFGLLGARALAGDWDGNGVVRPATFSGGTWTVRRSPTRVQTFSFGQVGDLPVVGDWDGDGRDGIGVYRDGQWLLRDSVSAGEPDHDFALGAAAARAVAGDWNGDGVDTVGTFADGSWRLSNVLSGGTADVSFRFGRSGDVPVVGDWDGSGRPGVGVFRAGRWLLTNAQTGGPARYDVTFGAPTSKPVVWR